MWQYDSIGLNHTCKQPTESYSAGYNISPIGVFITIGIQFERLYPFSIKSQKVGGGWPTRGDLCPSLA